MVNREFYIRYRIYTQVAQRADGNYPDRAKRSLLNLHYALVIADDFWNRDYRNEKMLQITFMPDNGKNVNPKFSELIAAISSYFNTVAIWEEKLFIGSVVNIKTFTIIGYEVDCRLAMHHISKVINNLNTMRFNLRTNYRRLKINTRRRDGKPNPIHAHASSSKKYYESISIVCNTSKEILDNRIVYTKNEQKYSDICLHIMNHKKLNFKSYNGEKKIHQAFCRGNKFVNNRIITMI